MCSEIWRFLQIFSPSAILFIYFCKFFFFKQNFCAEIETVHRFGLALVISYTLCMYTKHCIIGLLLNIVVLVNNTLYTNIVYENTLILSSHLWVLFVHNIQAKLSKLVVQVSVHTSRHWQLAFQTPINFERSQANQYFGNKYYHDFFCVYCNTQWVYISIICLLLYLIKLSDPETDAWRRLTSR